MYPSTGVTIAATSAWGLVKETAAAVSVVTIWRQEPAWSAPSAKMVSCQLSYLQDGLNVFILYLLHCNTGNSLMVHCEISKTSQSTELDRVTAGKKRAL